MNRPMFKYPGSAWLKSKQLIKLLPDPALYDTYVEPCAGSAATFCQLEHVPRHVVLGDTNGELINFLIQLRVNGRELVNQINQTYWSQLEFRIAHGCEAYISDLELARRFYVKMEMSRRPYDKRPSFKNNYMVARRKDGTGPMTMPSRRFGDTSHLTEYRERIKLAHIETRDMFEVMDKYAYDRSLMVIDPPWLKSTRVNKRLYKGEDGDDIAFHERILTAVKHMPGYWVLLGNRSDMYDEALDGWVERVDLRSRTDSGRGAVECAYINYEPTHLQDRNLTSGWVRISDGAVKRRRIT